MTIAPPTDPSQPVDYNDIVHMMLAIWKTPDRERIFDHFPKFNTWEAMTIFDRLLGHMVEIDRQVCRNAVLDLARKRREQAHTPAPEPPAAPAASRTHPRSVASPRPEAKPKDA